MSGQLSSLANAPARCIACVLSRANGGDDVDVVDVDVDTGYQVALLVLRIMTEDQEQGSG